MHRNYSNYPTESSLQDSLTPHRSPRQSTINAILQFAEIYPVKEVGNNRILPYLYTLKS